MYCRNNYSSQWGFSNNLQVFQLMVSQSVQEIFGVKCSISEMQDSFTALWNTAAFCFSNIPTNIVAFNNICPCVLKDQSTWKQFPFSHFTGLVPPSWHSGYLETSQYSPLGSACRVPSLSWEIKDNSVLANYIQSISLAPPKTFENYTY